LAFSLLKGDSLLKMDKKVIGKSINAIHLRSYFKPSQKEGNN
jgi:hypothetical protein